MDFENLTSIIVWFNAEFGLNLPPETIAVAILAPVIILGAWYFVRRAKLTVTQTVFDPNALGYDDKLVVKHIRDELRQLQDELHGAVEKHSSSKVLPLLRMLSARIDDTHSLVDDSGTDRDENPNRLDRWGRVPKQQMLRLVRQTLMNNLWAGNAFTESSTRPHNFKAMLSYEDGTLAINVVTPYASQNEIDPPYRVTIVRHNGRHRAKILDIEWDPANPEKIHDSAWQRGTWEGAILDWNLGHEHGPKYNNPVDAGLDGKYSDASSSEAAA